MGQKFSLPVAATPFFNSGPAPMLNPNEGPLDRALRISGGIFMMFLGFFSGWIAAPMTVLVGSVGVVMFVTGLLGSCPAYSIFGLSTLRS